MNTPLYDKEYVNDDYKEQLESLRSRFHNRTQNALRGRKIDKTPMPNATTIVYLHDEPDGGVSVSNTGDFVEYFNHRYGDSNRLGAMRLALSHAEKKAEASGEFAKRQRCEKVRQQEGGKSWQGRVRTVRRPLALVNAFFALLLVLSVTMLLGSASLLGTVAPADKATAERTAVSEVMMAKATPSVNDRYLDTAEENSAEVFAVEETESEGGVLALLSALGFFGK